MKLKALVLGVMGFAVAQAYAVQPASNSAAAPQNDKEKLSYTIGYDMGDNFKSQQINVDPNYLMKGITDGMGGNTPIMTKQQMEDTLIGFQKQLLAKRADKFKDSSAQNGKEGESFLAANKTKPGVETLPSGLQYKVMTPGTGASPTMKDTVTVDYAGTFINGKEFDSSYKRGRAATFPLTEVIPGWQEALTHMKTGATWEVYVPAKLAYGDRVMGPIGPNQTLIFKIHLINIKGGDNAVAGATPAATPASTPATN